MHKQNMKVSQAMPPTASARKPYCSLGKLSAWQWVSFSVLFMLWWSFTTTQMKWIAVLFATLYSVIEWNFYRFSTDHMDGTTTLSWTPVKAGFTTVEQWIMNVLYIPVLVFGFRALVPYPLLRIILSPFNVWTLEIVEGSILMVFYRGVNPAWDYSDKPDGCLNGLIKIGHWRFWVGLGIIIEVAAAVLPIASG